MPMGPYGGSKMDDLRQNDLGGDISKDNPAKELHQFLLPAGQHYGYPHCYTKYFIPDGFG
jgi:hypothetical protein